LPCWIETFHECSLLCLRYLVKGGFELLSGFGSSDGRSDTEACGTHSPRGTSQTPLSSWGALPTPRVPATQAVGDGHVMTHMCHPSKARRMASVTIQVPMQGICTPATRIALWPAKLPSQAMSSSRPRARWPVKTCEKRNKQAKPNALRQNGHITMPSPTRLPRSIHRSMQHTTGIRIISISWHHVSESHFAMLWHTLFLLV